jgi:hypothetical protein
MIKNFWLEIFKERECCGDQDTNKNIILKLIVRKLIVERQTTQK